MPDRATIPPHVERSLRRRLDGDADHGAPLPRPLRQRLEQSFAQDLGDLRVNTDAGAEALARTFGAEAFACGPQLFFRSGRFAPHTAAGYRLLAHEVAHAVTSGGPGGPGGTGPIRVSAPDDAAERRADAAADAAARGAVVPGELLRRTPGECTGPVVHRHASWEHRLLGDARPGDLNAIAKNLGDRHKLLTDLRDFLWMWHQDPLSVTEAMITKRYPYIRTLKLHKSQLLVTYGELNTLPDYMANPGVLDAQPREILLPILQAVRQEGYNRVQNLLKGKTANFAGAVSINTSWSFINLLLETRALDNLTQHIGPKQTNHYTALVGRNACHFAPYSWYRWEQHYLIARHYAEVAHKEKNPSAKAMKEYQAWMYHGYADHFLQDSFAAGHLVNKTLVMQWFIEWAAHNDEILPVPVADWDKVKDMTVEKQPGLAAHGLYNPKNPGHVRDPQTAEEQSTLQERMDTCGVRHDGKTSQHSAYLHYLAFLNGTVIQSASGVLHDNYNKQSLWVTSAAHSQAYQIWGDDTMLNGGDGVRIASETAQMSQQSILDVLKTGKSSITQQSIRDRFPSHAKHGKDLFSLEAWHAHIKPDALKLFHDVHYILLRAYPRIGHISIDAPNDLDLPWTDERDLHPAHT